MLNKPLSKLKIVTCHLGNGASISAIKRGKCIDTSMGFTPLPGLMMGTRCGSIDPAIIEFISQKEGKTIEEIMEILNKESGMLGISGISSDFRDIEEAIADGNERAELSLKMFAHKAKFYIGAYIAEMNGIDALVFTAGVGENDVQARDIICSELYNLGIKLDLVRNKVRGKEAILSPEGSDVSVLLIPTNEELMIARDTYDLVVTD
jgi:acetate kinase